MDQEQLQEFCKLTSAPREQAEYFLSLADGNLQQAVSLYYDDPDAMPKVQVHTDAAPQRSSGQSQQNSASSHLASSSKPPTNSASSKSKIGTINTVKHESLEDEEEQGQAFYAGGSEHGSGQQIVGPKKAKPEDARGVVSKLFNAARQLGAEEVHDEQTQQVRGPAAFGGAGYRLGSTADPSSVIGTSFKAAAAEANAAPNETEVVLKFWSNGFSIDDGPLRAFDDPANADFLKAIRRGEVPTELRSANRTPGERVAVRLEDHHDDEYHAPKITVKPFAGTGQKLVSDGDRVSSDSTEANRTISPNRITVTDAQPTTQVQIRFPDGSRIAVRCNQLNTIRDIRAHVLAERPSLQNAVFTFASAFPGKPVENEERTVKDAGLLNAALIVKLG